LEKKISKPGGNRKTGLTKTDRQGNSMMRRARFAKRQAEARSRGLLGKRRQPLGWRSTARTRKIKEDSRKQRAVWDRGVNQADECVAHLHHIEGKVSLFVLRKRGKTVAENVKWFVDVRKAHRHRHLFNAL